MIKSIHDEEFRTKIRDYFSTELTMTEVARDENTQASIVQKIWIEEFGKEKVIERQSKISRVYNSRRVPTVLNAQQIVDIENEFFNDLCVRDMSKKFRIYEDKIRKIWMDKFGIEQYNQRQLRIKVLLRDRKQRSPNRIQWHNNIEFVNKCKEYFLTDLRLMQITKLLGCSSAPIKKCWEDNFGEQVVLERFERVNLTLHSRPFTKEEEDLCKEHFKNIELPASQVANLIQRGEASVRRFWKKEFGLQAYNERTNRIKQLAPEKTRKHYASLSPEALAKINQKKYESRLKSGFEGSKNELLCCQMLREKLPQYQIEHHNTSLYPGKEIDIVISEIKIAIEWDGLVHRESIFRSEEELADTQKSDKQKNTRLTDLGYFVIRIEDNWSYSEFFVKDRVEKIVQLINLKLEGIITDNLAIIKYDGNNEFKTKAKLVKTPRPPAKGPGAWPDQYVEIGCSKCKRKPKEHLEEKGNKLRYGGNGLCHSCFSVNQYHAKREELGLKGKDLRKPEQWAFNYASCIKCKRTDRKHIALGLCEFCYHQEERAKREPIKKEGCCIDCSRSFNGEVTFSAHGRCRGCSSKFNRLGRVENKQLPKEHTKCSVCERSFEEITYSHSGMCVSCHNKIYTEKKKGTIQEIEVVTHDLPNKICIHCKGKSELLVRKKLCPSCYSDEGIKEEYFPLEVELAKKKKHYKQIDNWKKETGYRYDKIHADRTVEINRAYRDNNREKVRETNRQWRAQNKEKLRQQDRERYSKKKLAINA